MGKHSTSESVEKVAKLSPISSPLLDGKLADRSVKLVRNLLSCEKKARETVKAKGGRAPRLVKRGVAEVTKALRKNETGIVYLAGDVFPIDILAHLPIFCEEKNVPYGYLASKQLLGSACNCTRPASVVMITIPTAGDAVDKDTQELFDKVASGIKKVNPYL